MPRLTRTQKFADLREQLANGKEDNSVSQTLSSYQNRLNNVEDILFPTSKEDKKIVSSIEQQFNEALYDLVQDNAKQKEVNPDYVWVPFEETAVKDESLIDDAIIKEAAAPVFETPVVETPVVQTPVVETPVVEAAPVIETPVVETPVVETPVVEATPVVEEPAVEATPVLEPVETPVVETPTVEEVVVEEKKEEPKQEESTSSYFDSFMNTASTDKQNNDYNSYFESVNSALDQLSSNTENVFADVADESGEFVTNKERDTYLNQTLSDVNAYNTVNGEDTIHTTVDNLIDEIRHPEYEDVKPIKEVLVEDAIIEQPKEEENSFAWNSIGVDPLDADKVQEEVNANIDEDEFSSTVSLEITKIMDEIANTQEEKKLEDISSEIPVFEETKTTDLFRESVEKANEAKANAKPEDGVEIKNIAEMDEEPVNTMSSTIPFVVAAEDEEVLDEDEEDGSNTVLNVILVVLIVVLVAVLGLIVFYILKTKGIL